MSYQEPKKEVSGLFGSHGGGSPSLGHLLHIGGGGEGVIILPWFIRHCASVGGGVWFLDYLVPGEYLVCLVHVGWEERLVSLLWAIGHRVSVRRICSCWGLLHLVYVGKLSFCPFSGQPLLVIPPWAIIFL